MTDTSNRVRYWRLDRGLSQEDLAVRAGTTKQHISRLEAGNRRLDQHWLRVLARALDVAPTDLLPLTDHPPASAGDEAILARLRSFAEPAAALTYLPETEDERDLMSLFRRLPPGEKPRLLAVARLFVDQAA